MHFGANWSFSGQAIGTRTWLKDGTETFGRGFFAELARSGQHFEYSASYSDRSPRFHSEVGYVPRVDVRQASQYLGYSWRPQGSRLTTLGPTLAMAVNLDRSGRMQDWYANPEIQIELSGPTGLRISRFEAGELYLNTVFRYHRTNLSFYSNGISWLLVYGSLAGGTGINYSPAPGLAPFLANPPDASPGPLLPPVPRLGIDLVHHYNAPSLQRRSEPGSGSAQ